MKLKTSFFNGAVLKKDITRFAPAWGIYTVLSLLYVILLWNDNFYEVTGTFQFMATVNLVYAGITAVLLFGDLYNSRLCNALHAMPMRREGWFLTHLTAGLLFCFVPNAFGAVVAATLLKEAAYLAFLWLAFTVLEYLFFFGVAVFCVQCAGNRLGALASYGLVNFLAVLVAWLGETFYAPVLPGVILDVSGFADFSPVVPLTAERFLEVDYDNFNGLTVESIDMSQWYYLFVVAAVGVVFVALALLIYRKRNLEKAGDFISLKPAAPVFLIIYTLFVGAILYLVADLFNTDAEYLFLVVGLAIGFFTGRMLLEKKVRVFQGKYLLRFGILLFCFFGTIFVTWLDPLGIVRHVPKAEQVASVTISPYEKDGFYNSYAWDGFYYRSERTDLTLTDAEDIENIVKVHEYCVENRYNQRETDTPLTISYKMKSGAVVKRLYYLNVGTEAGQILKPYYSSPEYILGTDDLEGFLSHVRYIEYYSHTEPYFNVNMNPWYAATGVLREAQGVVYNYEGSLAGQAIPEGLIKAIIADCEEGSLAQLWDYHSEGTALGAFSIEYTLPNKSTRYMNITVYSDSVHIVGYLKLLQAS